MTKKKKEPIFVRGNAQEPAAEIGLHLTWRRFEITVRYKALDQKKKKWETYTRRVSRFSLVDARFEYERQRVSFEGKKNSELLSIDLTSINIRS